MAGESFNRDRSGFRFGGGWKPTSAPDGKDPKAYNTLVNTRTVTDETIQTRPGQTLTFATGGAPVTDLRSYVALSMDGLPRFLARDNLDHIYLDNGVQVGSLTAGAQGATLIPFRPNQSPNPYMYVANGSDYQKFSAPDSSNAVIQQNVGIAEPQDSCEAAQAAQQFTEVLSPGGNWNTGGTASAWSSGDRSTDIIVTAIADPVFPVAEGHIIPSTPPRVSIQVSSTVQYQRGEILYFSGASPFISIVEEVIAPLAISMSVQAIYYKQGPPGLAVVSLQGITAPSRGKPQQTQSGIILDNSDVIAQLVRGALIRIGTETAYVRSVTSGPDSQICIETFLNNNHLVGESVIGLPTIIVNGVPSGATFTAGTPIIGDMGNVETFTTGVGIGTLTSGPPGGGPTGTIISTPVVSLNGLSPNQHVGAFELGINQNFGWGLDPSSHPGYTNPNNAIDGNDTTFASAIGQHTHTYYSCIWSFTSGTPQSNMVLNILSRVLANGDDGLIVTRRSAGIWYSLDNSVTWQQIYNMGPDLPTPQPLSRPKQWDSIPLPANQDITQIQVMAFTDSHDDMAHYVYSINISAGAASIGVGTGAYQESDYLHFSVLTDNPANLEEMRLQFDVSDGTFLSNYYYYAVRPSDLVPATTATNPITQLAAIQSIVSQSTTESEASELGLALSAPSVAGEGQWTEVWIPISELTRIGGDQTKTLATINSVQIFVNALATIRMSISSIAFVGGGQPDVGQIGEPYRYRVRPRSSVTGAIGNPSPDMRYGVGAVRQPVQVNLPSALYDSQIDTWDVFRFGGSVTSWRFIGSCKSTNPSFQDNYFDDAAQAGSALDFDNFEPWPSIDLPFSGTATTIVGTEALVTIPGATNALRFLPGNLVNLGGQSVYTLRHRPTLLSGTSYLFEFDECTVGFNQGSITDNGQVTIYEPAIARQFLPYMWGPDVNGTVFAVGDPLRPGTLYFAKGNAPDSAPDRYNQEICPPSEPLMGGEVVDGLSFAASSERWWALYPQPSNPAQRYNPVQQPLPRGLAAPLGHCTDGTSLYWWAKDGIWSSTKGSLTDGDLYSLFPHEGVIGEAATYGAPTLGHTVLPPDYSRAGTFRLTYSNSYLYATYQDSNGVYNTLVLDLRRGEWSVDVYATQVSRFYHPEQQVGTLISNSTRYPELVMANITGQVLTQTVNANDNGTPISCIAATFEDMGGDIRAPKQWGDIFLDATIPAGLTVHLMSLGLEVATPITVPSSTAPRTRQPLGVGGLVVSDFMGLLIQWTDDFSIQTSPTILYVWHSSFVVQPAATISWTTMGSSFGMQGYGHLRQIAVAYISSSDITLTITSYDGQSPAPITIPSSAGRYVKTLFPVSANKGQLYSFAATSIKPFQFFLEDCEIALGPWSRQDSYTQLKTLSGAFVDSGPI